MRLSNYSRHVVDLQRAKENEDVTVTTEMPGAVICHITGHPNVVIYYNLLAETAEVHVYDYLTILRAHHTNQPLTLARTLCGLYPTR